MIGASVIEPKRDETAGEQGLGEVGDGLPGVRRGKRVALGQNRGNFAEGARSVDGSVIVRANAIELEAALATEAERPLEERRDATRRCDSPLEEESVPRVRRMHLARNHGHGGERLSWF